MSSTITGTWTRLATAAQLQRSSHTLATVNHNIYIFGGELKPREPRDNDIHTVSVSDIDSVNVKTIPSKSAAESPSPRVGSATASLNGHVYLFSGRGGTAMAPIEESGALWAFDTSTDTWTEHQTFGNNFPAARSYHAMTSDGANEVYVHAGCPESGRLSDLWRFSISRKEWNQLASAPDPPRGGTSIAYVDGKIFRMNGFDGKHEQGGALDVYSPSANSWSTISFLADGREGPGARSVAALVPVRIEGKGDCLVTLFGESDPSSLGHMGAGKMLSDVWVFEIGSRKWSLVVPSGKDHAPSGRGWFDADVIKMDNGRDAVVVAGGLGESNERLDDVWVLRF